MAHEITGVKVAQKKGIRFPLKLAKKEKKTWHKLFDDASTKEAVADDTASSNTDITSCVSQTTRSMDTHAIQCEKEYWSDLRADTGTLFFPYKIVMEQHNLTHFPSQPWSKEAKRFEESVGDLTNDQNSAKMPEDVDHEHKS